MSSSETFTNLTIRTGRRAFLKANRLIYKNEQKARKTVRKSALMRNAIHCYDNDNYAVRSQLKELHDLAYNNGDIITIDFVSSETGKQWLDNDGKTPVKVIIDSELAKGILHRMANDRIKSLHDYVYIAIKHGIEQSMSEMQK